MRIDLFEAPVRPIAPGDAFTIRAGCDKQFATCKAKFANAVNFRGFPLMPGDDVVVRYPNRGDANSGQPLGRRGSMDDQHQTRTPPGARRSARVIAIARDWIGTPYRHQASTRGAGCDCLGLARGVWRALHGVEPTEPPPYTRDWGEAGAREVSRRCRTPFLIERLSRSWPRRADPVPHAPRRRRRSTAAS